MVTLSSATFVAYIFAYFHFTLYNIISIIWLKISAVLCSFFIFFCFLFCSVSCRQDVCELKAGILLLGRRDACMFSGVFILSL